ncbi:MAG TPA: amidophosphoribosyltransferase [Flavobacteriaceae bacterium]|nr:amidophosphoribosyltransferase [Flavobacteriaceae bacterium]
MQAFYNSDYFAGGRWRVEGTIENIVCTLKNDITPYTDSILQSATQELRKILINDLLKILEYTELDTITVCVVPRAKVNYNEKQLLFKFTIREVISQLSEFIDGTDFIIRHTDTRTTHRDRAGYGGNGDLPFPGITQETCTISEEVVEKNILLIDDLYTKSINIDEDVIQALLDENANTVFFYAIGRTVK